MIIVKKLEAKEVLEALIYMFAETLPEEMKAMAGTSEIAASFGDNNSVEIYLITDDSNSSNNDKQKN